MNPYITMPQITRETSSGFIKDTLQDEMFQHREVLCIGEINTDSVNSLIIQLHHLHRQSPDSEITMYINSPGGEVTSGLALYDVMQGISCSIRTVCMGTAASMGALLFLSGNQRDILPHSKVMLHDPLVSGGIGGSALEVERRAQQLMQTREITARIIAKHTGKTLKKIYEVTKQDSYFNAEEAVAFGLADRIITEMRGGI